MFNTMSWPSALPADIHDDGDVMETRDYLILSSLLNSTRTANETIELIRRNDFKDGIYREYIHFYTHLNKRFDQLKKKGLLIQCGKKKVPGTRGEQKTWTLTKLAETMVLEIQAQDKAA